MGRVSGKVALVTGGAMGIGKALFLACFVDEADLGDVTDILCLA